MQQAGDFAAVAVGGAADTKQGVCIMLADQAQDGKDVGVGGVCAYAELGCCEGGAERVLEVGDRVCVASEGAGGDEDDALGRPVGEEGRDESLEGGVEVDRSVGAGG